MNNYAPLFVSIENPYLTDADRLLLQHPRVGGLVIFSKNFTSKQQMAALIAQIKALKSPPLLISVDHEGGRVQRFKEGFTLIPPMHAIGQIYQADHEQGLILAKASGYIIGTELGAIGVDFSFTPVLDLDYGANSVIGNRSFHHDPEAVIHLAGALINGLAQTGMPAIGKHFPGHGYVSKDSHLELPEDPRSLAQMAPDLRPFQALQAKLAGMMTAHVRYPQIDPDIASFSAYWLKTLLRQQWSYQGLIFSDDLRMKALDEIAEMNARAQLALDAGCDVILLCNEPTEKLIELADQLLPRQGTLDYTRLVNHPQSDPKTYEAAKHTLSQLNYKAQQPAADIVDPVSLL
ncbi:MAG TPA: beta-N-acetylhexosaminidase [Gammaproteobacteria bacterium]|nr:beta-N-acetylhexosaminidase [Gammaproteobacteria bacterium]